MGESKDTESSKEAERARPERESDLFAISHGAFRLRDREKIYAKAIALEQSGQTWSDVVADFHRSGHWGFKLLRLDHPETVIPVSPEAQKTKDVRAFFWTAIQSLVILKGVILYFGLNYAMEREEFYGGANKTFYAWGLGISIAVSFGGLLLFAIRKSRARHWD